MKKKSLICAMLISTISTIAFADDMFTYEYRANKNNEATQQYIAGAGEAIYSMNYRLETMFRPTLYCPPKQVRLNTKNYLDIVDYELMAHQADKKYTTMTSISDVLLNGLIRSFPCKVEKTR